MKQNRIDALKATRKYGMKYAALGDNHVLSIDYAIRKAAPVWADTCPDPENIVMCYFGQYMVISTRYEKDNYDTVIAVLSTEKITDRQAYVIAMTYSVRERAQDLAAAWMAKGFDRDTAISLVQSEMNRLSDSFAKEFNEEPDYNVDCDLYRADDTFCELEEVEPAEQTTEQAAEQTTEQAAEPAEQSKQSEKMTTFEPVSISPATLCNPKPAAPIVSIDYAVKMPSKKQSKRTGYRTEELYHVLENDAEPTFHRARGNRKLGGYAAFNLLPIVTCSACCMGTCDGRCYAVKNVLCHGYDYAKNNCLHAWADNTALILEDLPGFICEMRKQLARYKKPYFRIHSSGDFATVKYARAWYQLAAEFPHIRFLAFTKAFDIVRQVRFCDLPNFELVLSGWPGVAIPADLAALYRCSFPVETFDDIPEDAFRCPGSCENCAECWNLCEHSHDVYFIYH